MNVVVLGGTKGVGQLLSAYFKLKNADVKEFGKSSSFDEVVDVAKTCDVFICNAYADGRQLNYIETLKDYNIKIIVSGSIAADSPDPDMPVYSLDKKNLRERVLEISQSRHTCKADILLLTLTGTAVKEYQTIHNTIDYWLENSTINEIRFTI